jgi:NADH-quinone oxidoreductase subunit E
MGLDYSQIVNGIIEKYNGRKEAIIPILQDVQSELRWLPPEAISLISKRLKISESNIYSIATFYKSFYLKPRGEHVVTVCMGTACHVRGGGKIVDALSEKLKIKPGGITSDGKFTLETVNCVGCCAIGPIVILDGEYYGKVSPNMATGLLESIGKEMKNVGSEKS